MTQPSEGNQSSSDPSLMSSKSGVEKKRTPVSGSTDLPAAPRPQ